MTWYQIIQFIWPIAATITPVVMLGGFAWLKTKFPAIEDVEDIEDQLRDLRERKVKTESRLDTIERDLQSAPTRADLQNIISNLSERIGGLEAQNRGFERQLKTQNDYLQVLVERGMNP